MIFVFFIQKKNTDCLSGVPFNFHCFLIIFIKLTHRITLANHSSEKKWHWEIQCDIIIKINIFITYREPIGSKLNLKYWSYKRRYNAIEEEHATSSFQRLQSEVSSTASSDYWFEAWLLFTIISLSRLIAERHGLQSSRRVIGRSTSKINSYEQCDLLSPKNSTHRPVWLL